MKIVTIVALIFLKRANIVETYNKAVLVYISHAKEQKS
jgi:hypothetical protein